MPPSELPLGLSSANQQSQTDSSNSLSPLSVGSGRGRKHGTSNSQPFDRWFRYPAGFASDYAETLLHTLEISPGGLIIDCFAGSGVSGTAATHAGYDFFGIEAHPLIAELAQLKLAAPPLDGGLLKLAIQVSEMAGATLADRINSQQFSSLSQPDLVKRCFDSTCLEELIAIRDSLKSLNNDWAPYLKWALLASLRDLASAKVGWPYQRPSLSRKPTFASPIKRFLTRAGFISEDLQSLSSAPPRGIVACGDARIAESWKHDFGRPAEACLTSPPYLNNFDYADATRLELYFWGEVTSWASMVTSVRSGMITATTQQSSVGSAAAAANLLEPFPDIAKRIKALTDELGKQRKERKRGKEYDRVVPDYFSGILQTLINLAANLSSGAPSAWLIGDSAPYGVYIDTPKIIGEIASQVGFVVEQDITLRRRGQRWGSSAIRHDVPLSERILMFRRT